MASKKPLVIGYSVKSTHPAAKKTEGTDKKQDNFKYKGKWDKTASGKQDHQGFNFKKNGSLKKSQLQRWWNADDDKMILRSHVDDKANWFDEIPTVFQKIAEKKSATDAKEETYIADSVTLSQMTQAVENAHKAACIQVAKDKKKLGAQSDDNWVNETIKSGTLSDKIAAMALKIQESPFYSLNMFDELVAIACRKDQRAAQHALEAVKDLLVSNLLPDRQLVAFSKQPLLHPQMTLDAAALLWFEGQLKQKVSRLLSGLEDGLKSNQEYFKRICMEMVRDLLISKPEQETRLLSMLVNKLGDPKGNACAKCIEHLKAIIKPHPGMKLVIVREVRQFLSRPDLKLRSVYNGVIFLSSISLVGGDHDVATQLVQCYMGLFHKALKEDEMGSRLLSALLTGVNRSLPYLDNTDALTTHVDSLFLVVHTSSFSSATQALILLSHIALQSNTKAKSQKGSYEMAQPVDSDLARRFYRALYARLLSDQVAAHSKNTAFLNLLYRSIKGDTHERRAMAFLKRLSICATQSTPPVAAGLIFLISEILAHRPKLLTVFTAPESVSDYVGINQAGSDTTCSSDEEDEGKEQKATGAHGSGQKLLGNFDASKREPEYAVPENVPGATLWEASLLNMHFHPSVQAFAQALLQSDEHRIEFKGDPTVEFNLTSFLNRFAYKNPKTSISDKIKRAQGSIKEEPINVRSFVEAEVDEVGPDKLFYHKYFNERDALRNMGRSRDRSRKSHDDADEDEEDDFEMTEGAEAGDAEDIESGGDDEDGEGAMDRFADRLAEKMMRDHEAQNMPDEEEFSSDAGSEDDVSSDDALDFADFVQKSKVVKNVLEKETKGGKKHQNGVDLSDDEDGEDDDASSSDDGYEGLVPYGDGEEEVEEAVEDHSQSVDDEDEEEDGSSCENDYSLIEEEFSEDGDEGDFSEPRKGRKFKKSTSSAAVDDDDIFAAAADYEGEMEDIVQKIAEANHSEEPERGASGKKRSVESFAAQESKTLNLRKRTKKSKMR